MFSSAKVEDSGAMLSFVHKAVLNQNEAKDTYIYLYLGFHIEFSLYILCHAPIPPKMFGIVLLIRKQLLINIYLFFWSMVTKVCFVWAVDGTV